MQAFLNHRRGHLSFDSPLTWDSGKLSSPRRRPYRPPAAANGIGAQPPAPWPPLPLLSPSLPCLLPLYPIAVIGDATGPLSRRLDPSPTDWIRHALAASTSYWSDPPRASRIRLPPASAAHQASESRRAG
ncbi:hypothetical protein BS78_04G228500 [Paspalum vaginatum]|nr:hypothetical protein BS78_04G228500 [Paspalum vaginatum]